MLRPFVAYLLRGRLAFPGGHRPPAGHTVPVRFAGVGVAASPDPLVDDWIIATVITSYSIHYTKLYEESRYRRGQSGLQKQHLG